MRILVTAALFSALAFAQTKITSVEGITEYRLDNGLQVLLFPDNSKPTFTVNVTYMVGSRHEGYGETGMAHLLEHMLFKGTDKHKATSWPSSAPTAPPSTAPPITTAPITSKPCPPPTTISAGPSKWKPTAWFNSRVSRKDLDSEMTVVRNEFEMRRKQRRPRPRRARRSPPPISGTATAAATIGTRSDIETGPDRRVCRLSIICTTSPITPCWWWPASSTTPRPRLDQGHLRRDPQAHPQAHPDLHRGAHAGRRARSHPPPHRRHADRDDGLPHPRWLRIPMPPRSKFWPPLWANALRPSLQSTGRHQESRLRFAPTDDFHDPGCLMFRPPRIKKVPLTMSKKPCSASSTAS